MDSKQIELDAGLLSYLRQADATYRNGFEDAEMKQMFLEGVFEEIRGCEVKFSLMKSTCFVMEQFVDEATPEQLLKVLKAFQTRFEEIAHSQQGCHVLQKALQRVIFLWNSHGLQESDSFDEICKAILKSSQLLKKDGALTEWMCDTYATHATRSIVQTLGGAVLSQKHSLMDSKKSTVNTQQETFVSKDQLPKKFLVRLKKFSMLVMDLNKKSIAEIFTHASGCPCVCTLIQVLSKRLPKALKSLCNKILSVCTKENNSTILILCKDRTGSRAMEAILEYGDAESCTKLHTILTEDQDILLELACHPVANFVVQKLLCAPSLNAKFADTSKLLLPMIEDIFAESKFGVVQKLAEQCVQNKSTQTKFLDTILETFHCNEEEKRKFILPLIATFSTYETFVTAGKKIPDLSNIVYHGSLLLQTLFKFNENLLLAKSITVMPDRHSVSLSCNISGSHVIDAFLSSTTVKKKWKTKWFEKMKDQFHVIACDKYGSRVMDNMWKNSDFDIRTFLAESLAQHSDALLADQFGKHLHRNFGLKQFIHRRVEWDDFHRRQIKKRKAFEDAFATGQTNTKKKKS